MINMTRTNVGVQKWKRKKWVDGAGTAEGSLVGLRLGLVGGTGSALWSWLSSSISSVLGES